MSTFCACRFRGVFLGVSSKSISLHARIPPSTLLTSFPNRPIASIFSACRQPFLQFHSLCLGALAVGDVVVGLEDRNRRTRRVPLQSSWLGRPTASLATQPYNSSAAKIPVRDDTVNAAHANGIMHQIEGLATGTVSRVPSHTTGRNLLTSGTWAFMMVLRERIATGSYLILVAPELPRRRMRAMMQG